LFTIPHYVGFL